MLWPVLERSTAICMTRRRTRATLSGHAGRVLRFSIYLYPECIFYIYLTPPRAAYRGTVCTLVSRSRVLK